MRYKIGDIAHGGIVFSVDRKGRHGVVAAHWDVLCEGTSIHFPKKVIPFLANTGWRLPTKDELYLMYQHLYKKGLGDFATKSIFLDSAKAESDKYLYYMSSTPVSENAPSHKTWRLRFDKGEDGLWKDFAQARIRPVRDF